MSSSWGDSSDNDSSRQFPGMQCSFMITLDAVPADLRATLIDVLGETAAGQLLAPYESQSFTLFDVVCETYALSDVTLDPASRDATLFFEHGGLVVDHNGLLLWAIGETVSKKIGAHR